VTRAAAALAIVLAACSSTDNRPLLDELQREATAAPNATLDACVKDPGPYRLAAGSRRRTTLPMAAGKVPIVAGSINGAAMPFLIDTGTTHVVLSAAGARQSGLYLPQGLTVQLIAPGYRTRYRVGAPAQLSIGDHVLAGGVTAVPEARSDVPRRLGVKSPSNATVGGSVLSNFRVTLDFKTREVVLEPHGREPFAGVLWTEVKVNGQRCLMLVDTGANGIFLEPGFARSLGLIDEDEEQRHATKADKAGKARLTSVHIDSLTFSRHEFTDLRATVVLVAEEDGETVGALPRGGLLGLSGLGRHRWIVDYGERQLVLDEVR